ncbi:hypothetical protein [Paraglaciecola arctica]|uniref:SPOR domain-containing protein n=1 Tax=Paraglaciecola arctica BSs20135 TaxID=493475 RepID=K6YPJ0_9ALTE|nr:hypothetical protein [Paraglaciecola arctica]GAC20092.1 hypothetical protein GARC_3133 [Paraglaciecola arctica BSs20135]
MPKTNNKSLVPMINSNLSTLFFLVVNSALLAGCSMMNSDSEVLVKSELEQKLERYTDLEPEIQRILALESDMQIIVAELARYSTLGDDPMGTSTSETSVQVGSVQSPKAEDNNGAVTRTNVTAQKTHNCGSTLNGVSGHCNVEIGVHIAAFSDKKSVLSGWLYLEKKLPTELTRGKRPLRAEIVQQNIAYQSLRVGPFNSVTQAKKICDEARHLISCAVVEYLGSKVGK